MTEQLAAWVPSSILAGAVLIMGGYIWRSLTSRFDKMESAIEKLQEAVSKLHTYATVDQLGSMGNRLDERIADLRERVRVLEAKE